MSEKIQPPNNISKYSRVINSLKKLKKYRNLPDDKIYRKIKSYLKENPGKNNKQIYGTLSFGYGKPNTSESAYSDSGKLKNSSRWLKFKRKDGPKHI